MTHQYLYSEKHCNPLWWYWQQDKTHYTCNASEKGKEVGLSMRDGKAKLSEYSSIPQEAQDDSNTFVYCSISFLQCPVLYKSGKTKKVVSKNENESGHSRFDPELHEMQRKCFRRSTSSLVASDWYVPVPPNQYSTNQRWPFSEGLMSAYDPDLVFTRLLTLVLKSPSEDSRAKE